MAIPSQTARRARPLGALLIALLALPLACGRSTPPSRYTQKLVILGFDGMDPDLARRWMDEGRLPNMRKLADHGGFYRLETTHSPESPTAWASFATGVNAGKHNIYDFLVRDVATYLPDLGMVQREPPRFLFDYIPVSPPRITSTRGGTSFWVTAGAAGVRSTLLTVPVTFPPEDVPNGELLSGLPLPDIRGTMGTFYYYATDLSRYEEGNTEFGGILKRLVFDDGVAESELIGPPNPIVRQEQREIRAKGAGITDTDRARLAELDAAQDVRVPFTVRWSRGERRARIEIEGSTIDLAEREWSGWIPLEFRVNFLVRVHGKAQMYLVGAGEDLRLYISPVNWSAVQPPSPMSSPPSFARELHDALGDFRTLGWAEATWPLNEDRIDEQVFMDDLYRAFDDRAKVILNRLAAQEWDLFVGVIESTDRVQHMMWRLIDPVHPMYDARLAARFGDSIQRVYERSDEFVGRVLEHVPPDTPVLIVSDHGFHSFRQSVNLNTWLVQRGYMTLQGQAPGEKKLDDLFGGGGQFWENVDWSRTRAYAMGLGQIYLNLRGREARGIVAPGEEARRVADQVSADLMTMADPATGVRIVRAVYKRDAIYSGPFFENAAELQVGMEDGYRVSWQTTLGGSPAGIVYPNAKKWSGDHGAFDYKITEGILISNRKVTSGSTRIIDVAPTVLKHFNVSIPSSLDGAPLF